MYVCRWRNRNYIISHLLWRSYYPADSLHIFACVISTSSASSTLTVFIDFLLNESMNVDWKKYLGCDRRFVVHPVSDSQRSCDANPQFLFHWSFSFGFFLHVPLFSSLTFISLFQIFLIGFRLLQSNLLIILANWQLRKFQMRWKEKAFVLS